jgi:hypothetical protein
LPIYAGHGLRGYHNNYTRFATTKETIMQTTSEQLTEMHQTARQLIKTLELTETRHDRDAPLSIALAGNYNTGRRSAT